MNASVTERFPLSEGEIEAFCRRHHIRSLALFGSVLREDFGPESDVDVLVEFEEGRVPGFDFVRMQDELSRLLGLRKSGSLSLRGDEVPDNTVEVQLPLVKARFPSARVLWLRAYLSPRRKS